MASDLLLKIQEDMKAAMRAKDKKDLTTIRLLLAAIKQREIDERITLDDNEIISVIDKMIRQRHDSIEQFTKFERYDLAGKEKSELVLLKKYMPQPLTDFEIAIIIKDAINNTEAHSIKDMGKVMAEIKTKAHGRTDMAKVGAAVKNMLAT